MNCYLHPDRAATAFCRTCGRPLCPDDQREIYGVVYCQECLARPLGAAAPAATPPGFVPGIAPGPGVPVHGAPSPGIALLLGFIPGVGAIYNGQYLKAFLQVVIFAFLIAMSNSVGGPADVFFGLGIAGFYFYMLIDSYHTAKQLQAGLPTNDIFNLNQNQPLNAPVAAIILIAIGAIFLLRSLGFFDYDASRFLWPGILIALGGYLLIRHKGTPTP